MENSDFASAESFDDAIRSPYARVGAKLVDNGFSAIVAMPQTKRPGTYHDKRWVGDADWARYSERAPTFIETDIWSRWPGAGVCIVLGYNNVVAVDIDSDTSTLINDIESVIGQSPVGKIGRRGVTWFFRADPSAATARFKLPNGDGVDFLAKGAQTVIPGSVHPETGRPYVWQSDSLESYTPGRLPMLPVDIAERIADVMRHHGWLEPPKREHRDGGCGVWAAEKSAAMETRELWLPRLGFNLDRPGKRMNAAWRGSEDFNIAVYPDGFFDHVDNQQLSAIDVVMKARSCAAGEALDWLRPWIQIEEPEVVHFDFKKRERIDDPREEPETGESDDEFPVISGHELWDADVVEPWMLVPSLFQGMRVNNLVGDSGLGKSLLLLSLFMCIAAGKEEWFGIRLPYTGHPCVFFTAEENKGDAKKRLRKLAKAMNIHPEELKNLHIVPMGGSISTILGEADAKGKVSATKLWRKLEALVRRVQPIALGVDPIGEVLDGDDINKRTVRSFMALLRPLSEQMNMCTILASHPSMAGITNKTGRFGNVAWRASFRGAAHFYRDGELGEIDDGRRTLVGEKVQDGKPGLKIEFLFNEDGVLERVDKPAGGVGGVLNETAQAEYDFLAMFDKLARQGEIPLNNDKSADYAPKMFADRDGTPPSKRRGRVKSYKEAMNRLKDANRVRAVSHGPVSKHIKKIERVPPGENQNIVAAE
jgi:AAA domain/Bifunctional DNA primase/polymerase, N-terminal